MLTSEYSVSVLMSVYARENPSFFAESLASLSAQTHFPDELVLVEDGPLPDELDNVITAFRKELHIRSVRLPVNRGLAIALNEGLKHCQCEFVARMDSDDISVPGRLEVQLSEIYEDIGLDVIGGFVREIDDYGTMGQLRRVPLTHESIVDALWACPMLHPTVMFRRKRILEIGGYHPACLRSEDYELWFRCVREGLQLKNLGEVLVLYRFSEASHGKQSPKFAWERSLTGYRESSRSNLAYWKRLACFLPFVRSLLPLSVRHGVYRWSKCLDPRELKSH